MRTATFLWAFSLPCHESFSQSQVDKLDIPEPLISEAYERAATQNILAAVNPNIFFGYFSVCADGKGFGFGNTYPSLDGHQMKNLNFLSALVICCLSFSCTKELPSGRPY